MDPLTHDYAELFPILRRMVFLNHAGVAPLSKPAADALRVYAEQAETTTYVESGWYKRVGEVRKLAARLINARGPHEIAFVPNTSFGIASVAKGIDWQEGDSVVITDVEFPANRYPWEDIARRHQVELIEVKQLSDGRIDVEDVCDAINDRTRIVAISHVQYASGHRIDLKPIADEVHKLPYRPGYLCVDAIQSVGVLPVDVQAMGIDFLSADGHKWMLGPEGCGIFYCHEELIPQVHPNVVGWMGMVNATDYGNYDYRFLEDARRFEPGCWNVPGILSLGASLELLLSTGVEGIWRRVEALTTRLCEGVTKKGYRVVTPRRYADERSGIVIFEPVPGSGKPAPVEIVRSLQHRDIVLVVREGRLRAAPHFYNTLEQMDRVIEALP